MTVFVVIGVVGLIVLALSTVLGEVLELGDGAVSGTSLGAGAVAFGAIGSIVIANGLSVVWAYAASAALALVVVIGVGQVVKRLRASEDGKPRVLTGVTGLVTATIGPGRTGEVSLDDPTELERRLAWADTELPEGTRVVVVEQAGTRVKVARADG